MNIKMLVFSPCAHLFKIVNKPTTLDDQVHVDNTYQNTKEREREQWQYMYNKNINLLPFLTDIIIIDRQQREREREFL